MSRCNWPFSRYLPSNGQNLGFGGSLEHCPKGEKTCTGPMCSIMHKFHADRCHRRRDICKQDREIKNSKLSTLPYQCVAGKNKCININTKFFVLVTYPELQWTITVRLNPLKNTTYEYDLNFSEKGLKNYNEMVINKYNEITILCDCPWPPQFCDFLWVSRSVWTTSKLCI